MAWLASVTLGGAGCAAGTDATMDASGEAALFDTTVPDSTPPGDSGTPFDNATPDTGHGTDTGHDAPGMDTATPDTKPPVDAGTDTHVPDTSVPDTSTMADCGKPAPDSSVTCASSGFVGTLATWNLVGQTGDETSAPVSSTACGIGGSGITRAATITAVSGKDSINGSGWGTGASADGTRYDTFTITPAAGCSVTLSTLSLDVQASPTGPKTGDVATSADAFATHTASFAGTSKGTTTLTATGTGAIEVRVYGYGATGTGGTFRIQQTMTLSGSIL